MNSGLISSTLIKLRTILYVKWKAELIASAAPFRSPRPTLGLIFSSNITIVIPLSSIPRRPALPDIWMYSPEVIWLQLHHMHFNWIRAFFLPIPEDFQTAYPTIVLAVELTNIRKEYCTSRHVEAHGKGFRCEEDFDEAFAEQDFNCFFEQG